MSLHEEGAQHEAPRHDPINGDLGGGTECEDYVAAREQLLASIPEGFELLHVRRDS